MSVTIVMVRPIFYGFNILWVHNYPILRDDVTQVLYLLFVKITFTKLGIELVFS